MPFHIPDDTPPGHRNARRSSPGIYRRSGPAPVEAQVAALEDRDLIAGGARWQIEIYGVLEADRFRYLQLALHGESSYMVTAQLARGTGIRELIPALVRWLSRPTTSGAIIRVDINDPLLSPPTLTAAARASRRTAD